MQQAYLATGTIFKAKLLLMQKPAPPVANQNENVIWNKKVPLQIWILLAEMLWTF